MRRLPLLMTALALTGLLLVNPQTIAIGGIHVYQRTLAPLVAGLGARCRFTPTCSRWAEIVIARDGLVRGGWKTIKRVARCGPWTTTATAGTADDEP